MQATSFGSEQKRRLITGRKDKNKDGRPVLKMRIPEIPADLNGRVFETYTTDNGTFYWEIFSGFSGIVLDAYRGNKTIANQDVPFLFLEVESGGEPITWEVGQIDSSYATNLLSRMLNPYYRPENPASFGPYDVMMEGKRRIGVSIQQGADRIPSPTWEVFKEMGRPEPRQYEGKGGKIGYDFTPVAEWLLSKVQEKIKAGAPIISRDNGFEVTPIQTNVKASPAANTLNSSNVHQMMDSWAKLAEPVKDSGAYDDLPF